MDNEQLARFEQKFDKFATAIQLTLLGMQSDIAGLRADLDVVKSDVAVLKSDVAVLKSDVAVLKSDVEILKAQQAAMQLHMREAFENFHDRLVVLERSHAALGVELQALRKEIADLRELVMGLSHGMDEVQLRLLDLREDMQQRFRSVNERLAAVERRLAA